jgi:PilZ domain
MPERQQRHRTLKAGTIAFNQDGGISCAVRNLSNGGACLDVASQIGIPNTFTLVIPSAQLRRQSRVAWRRGNLIGVAFE